MLCFYIYMNMYMYIYIHIKQKFCALIPGFPRSRERKLLLKWSLQNGLFFSFPGFKESEQGLWCQM